MDRPESALRREEILRLVTSSRPAAFAAYDHAGVEAMKRLGATLKEAGQKLSRHKAAMTAEDKQRCFAAIQEVHATHDAWWAGYGPVRQERQTAYEAKLRSNLQRNRERHAVAVAALERHLARAGELKTGIASAWNPEWAAQARTQLANQEARIAEVRQTIDRVGAWIAEDEKRLAELR